MTKQDVIYQVTDKTGLDSLTSRVIIEAFFEVVKESLTEGKPIYIRRFGSFTLKRRAAKIGRHMSAGTSVAIAAHIIPSFKASPEFVEQIKKSILPTTS